MVKKILQNIGLIALAFVLLIGIRQAYFLVDQDLDLSTANIEIERLQKENVELSDTAQKLEDEYREKTIDMQNESYQGYNHLFSQIVSKIKSEYIKNFGIPPDIDTSDWERFEDEEYSIRIPSGYTETESEERTNTAGMYNQEFDVISRYWSYGEESYWFFVDKYPNLSMPPEEYAMLGGGEYPPKPLEKTTMKNTPVLIDVDMAGGRKDSVWLPGNNANEWYVLEMLYTTPDDWLESYAVEQEIFKAFVYSFKKK